MQAFAVFLNFLNSFNDLIFKDILSFLQLFLVIFSCFLLMSLFFLHLHGWWTFFTHILIVFIFVKGCILNKFKVRISRTTCTLTWTSFRYVLWNNVCLLILSFFSFYRDLKATISSSSSYNLLIIITFLIRLMFVVSIKSKVKSERLKALRRQW